VEWWRCGHGFVVVNIKASPYRHTITGISIKLNM
jgi:hypothetical protein